MTSKKRVLAVALAGVLLLSSVAAAGMVGSATANESLAVDVENAGNDGATVSVTHDDATLENASVTIEAADEDATYAGTGIYETDENGTVDLPEPAADVTVEVTAEKGNLTGSTTTELIADEEDDENGSFGQLVSSFVHEMLNAGDHDGPLGQLVSENVTSNNPGNAPEDAGKPADVGAQNSSAENSSAENGTDEGGSQGPPDHAGNDDGDDDDDSDEDGEDDRGNGNGKN
jgi:hypothetical protein